MTLDSFLEESPKPGKSGSEIAKGRIAGGVEGDELDCVLSAWHQGLGRWMSFDEWQFRKNTEEFEEIRARKGLKPMPKYHRDRELEGMGWEP